jgi:hypothetical protein
VSVTRGTFPSTYGTAIGVDAGAQQVTLSGNVLDTIDATGVAGLAVTGNSLFARNCLPGLSIAGDSSGTVENNVLGIIPTSGEGVCPAGSSLVSVGAGSAGSVTTAYNSFAAVAPYGDYSWGGTGYATAAALAAAVPGQAAQDQDLPTHWVTPNVLQEGSPLINSGNSNAPGVTATDLVGNHRTSDDPKDPVILGTGPGAVPMDRGAIEIEDGLSLKPVYSPANATGVAPFDFSVTPQASDTWGETLSTTVDFGDGSGPQPVTGGTATHVYPTPGVYSATTVVTSADGTTSTTRQQVTVGTVDAPQMVLTAGRATTESGSTPLTYPDSAEFTLSAGADSWEVDNGSIDFGDGSTGTFPVTDQLAHTYPHAGTYTAKVTSVDLIGRTVTASTTVTVGDEFLPVNPVRDYDSRTKGIDSVPAHGRVLLDLAQLNAAYVGTDGVGLTVTVTDAKAAGFLTVYPDAGGADAPTASTLDFAAGQTVPNTVLAAAGANGVVDFYNGSGRPIDLIVDTFGYELNAGTPGGGQIGDTYTPVGPVRVLDTRNGTGAAEAPVAGRHQVVLAVAGQNGVPADATAVVLNVATTDTKAAGFLTAYGDGGYIPGTSDSNWAAGQTVSNLVVVPLGNGKAVLDNGSSGSADFVADLVGYYNNLGTASVIVPTAGPVRVLDTRQGVGTGGRIAKIGAKQSIKLQLTGLNGLPVTGVTAAELNLTVTDDPGAGFITAFPDGTALPTASSLDFAPGQTVANASVVPVGPDGTIDLYNGSGSPVDLIADLSGYYYQG